MAPPLTIHPSASAPAVVAATVRTSRSGPSRRRRLSRFAFASAFAFGSPAGPSPAGPSLPPAPRTRSIARHSRSTRAGSGNASGGWGWGVRVVGHVGARLEARHLRVPPPRVVDPGPGARRPELRLAGVDHDHGHGRRPRVRRPQRPAPQRPAPQRRGGPVPLGRPPRPSRSVSRSTWRGLTGLSARFSRDSLAAANDRALPPAYSIFLSSPGL